MVRLVMHTKDVGDVAVAAVLKVLLQAECSVLIPFGDNLPYDLAVDEEGRLLRIQVRSGRLVDGAVVFRTSMSYAHRGRPPQNFYGRADYFGVFCPQIDEVFFVPVSKAGTSACSLRIAQARNGQSTGVRWAADYKQLPSFSLLAA